MRRIDYEKELNQEQLAVVLGGDGACLVLAGAGLEKTRTLTYRVAYLLEHGVDPASILLVTFTNKAAREMLSRVEGLVGPQARSIWGGTFHSLSSRLLRSLCRDLGYQPNFSILDAEDSRDLLKAVMKEAKIDTASKRFPSASVVADVISYARNAQQSIPDVLEIKHPNFLPHAAQMEDLARNYHLRKKAANVMDFDDLLSNLLLVVDDPVKGPAVTQAFQFVLVDEYQDTNAIQARLVKAFAQVHRNIVVVGDDAQSIYAFRGADVKNILSFPEQWPDTQLFRLVTNYRSTPEILDVANESLSNNEEQFKKELLAVREHGEKPKLISCASASQEAQFVAEQVLLLRQEGLALPRIAVLFRSSGHSQALEFELMKRDIPYEYRGGQKFFDRAHIKDTISFLRIVANHQDEVAWLRVLSLQVGIGAVTAQTVASQAKLQEGLESALSGSTLAMTLPARAQTGWQDFCQIMRSVQARGEAPGGMIRAIKSSVYREYLEREYPNYQERLEDIDQLALFADSYEKVEAFLADIALYDDMVARREEASHSVEERMVLSTIHQAKGLEWDTVFIIHLADQAFPNRRALSDEGGMEEERRLFYVAVTRAERRLFLTYPLTMGYDTLILNQPSTFIDELSPHLLERVEVRRSSSHATGHGRGASRAWGEDASWEEPTVEMDRYGERRTPGPIVWKSTAPPPKKNPGSFLRDIDEL